MPMAATAPGIALMIFMIFSLNYKCYFPIVSISPMTPRWRRLKNVKYWHHVQRLDKNCFLIKRVMKVGSLKDDINHKISD
jgi:hypothetical protein